MKKYNEKIKIAVYTSIAAIVLWSCSNIDVQEDNAHNIQETNLEPTSSVVKFSDEQIKVAEIRTGELENRVISEQIQSTGVIDVLPQHHASVSVPMEGYISKINFIEGQKLSKGQKAVLLKHPVYVDLQTEYLEISSELKFAEQEFSRQQILAKENVSAKKNLQRIEADLNKLKAKKTGLEAKLELLGVNLLKLKKGNIQKEIWVRTPISGSIEELNVHVGQYITPEQVLFEQVNSRKFRLRLEVFSQYSSKLEIGQKVEFLVSGNQQKRLAEVVSVGKLVNAERKTVVVYAKPVDCNVEPSQGDFITASIALSKQKQTVLPASAIIKGKNASVFIQEQQNRFRKVDINVGDIQEDWVVVLNPESLTDKKVVVQGANYLASVL